MVLALCRRGVVVPVLSFILVRGNLIKCLKKGHFDRMKYVNSLLLLIYLTLAKLNALNLGFKDEKSLK